MFRNLTGYEIDSLPQSYNLTDGHAFRRWSAAEEAIKIVNATRGRAFVLCTSFAGMNEMFERVASQIDYPCLVQGSAAKGELLKKFRATPNAVLFATSSFWQGVDVKGEALSAVIIDKLPFQVPTDPLVAARSSHIERNGGTRLIDIKQLCRPVQS